MLTYNNSVLANGPLGALNYMVSWSQQSTKPLMITPQKPPTETPSQVKEGTYPISEDAWYTGGSPRRNPSH